MADLRSLLWAYRDACHPCTGAQGAILLLDVRRGRSAGHRSDRGARGTGWDMVAPAESARPASLTSRLAAECAGGYRVGWGEAGRPARLARFRIPTRPRFARPPSPSGRDNRVCSTHCPHPALQEHKGSATCSAQSYPGLGTWLMSVWERPPSTTMSCPLI